MIYDTFLFNDELNMLECRLTELARYPEPVTHILVEAEMNHRGELKPLHYALNRDYFQPLPNPVIHIVASELPTPEENPDPWSREHAQREYCRIGLLNAVHGDIVLHGDVDEIPRMPALHDAIGRVRNGEQAVVLAMRQHQGAVDWLYPHLTWPGTIVTTYFTDGRFWGFSWLRDQRNHLPQQENGGWHLTWVGGPEMQRRKLATHCHLEMRPEEEQRVRSGQLYRDGITHGGTVQQPVEVDDDYPEYVRTRRCPPSWFRPRVEQA